MKVTVVDYGAGNIGSVANALWRAGGEPVVTSDPDRVRSAERIVLPGVGAAGAAIKAIRAGGLDQALDSARKAGRPFMGICVGMQVLADELLEFGNHRGLGWVRGIVAAIDPGENKSVRVPHIGWSEIDLGAKRSSVLGSRDRYFYFCHSFRLVRDEGIAVATVAHGEPYTCAIEFDNVFACQFHPEKSQIAGQRLIERFLAWKP
ncbi:MAG TPA: imidazole glycerol phosphate synthase subunit HisH [Xanthobacteraceae bacterium]|jgi:glutamine amidotransferase|nr:imidazole glycerol phosphate synthase subunit HisH [Xanthobacteraceae bacterium]